MRAPQTPPGRVHRRRLVEWLDAAVGSPLTLLTAPAGWGKTTLLESWAPLAARSGPVVWIRADDAGDDLARQVTEAAKAGGLDNAGNGPLIVVDGFPAAADAALLSEVERLVGDPMSGCRLVLAGRTDPALPLHRWRVDGVVSELRTADLAFTVDETAELLSQYGVGVSQSRVFRLHAATEGWAAALRLAALSSRSRAEPEWFLEDAGYLAAVAHYLIVEVIDPLPIDRQRQLLEMSIVDQVSADLVEALTGETHGAKLLAQLSSDNLFLDRVAGPDGWYRFHPLFARTLYAELGRRSPERISELHRRAATWYGVAGLPGDALRHALLAGQWNQATDLLSRHWTDLVAGPRSGSGYARPPTPPGPDLSSSLALAFAADRIRHSDPNAARGYLRTADRNTQPPDVARRVPLLARSIRLAETTLFGDPHAALRLAEPILEDPTDPPDDELRALVLLSAGRARLRLGQWEPARGQLRDALFIAQHNGMVHTQVSAAGLLTMLEAVQGRLRSAVWVSRQALAVAERSGLTDAGDLAWTRLGAAEAYHQWDRLPDAHQLVDRALDLAGDNIDVLAFAEVIRARLCFAEGRLSQAIEIILAARDEFPAAVAPLRTALALTEAELRLAAGDFSAAARLLADHPGGEAFAGWATVIDASIQYGEGRLAAAAATAARLAEPDPGVSLTWRVRAAVLTALVGQALGDRGRVIRGLESALAVADDEGFRRPFVAGGHAVRDLLASYAPALPVYHPVAAELANEVPDAGGWNAVAPSVPTRTPAGVLLEPLTERELTVLRYLQGTMSNEEIAATLYVSVNTVKTHIKNIYRKLNAGRRREAVRRARELRLL